MSKHDLRKLPRIYRQELPIEAQHLPIEERKSDEFWPEEKPMPDTYLQHRLPCPNCRRLRLTDGGRAARCKAIAHGVAYLRCAACGHEWKLLTG